MAFEAFSITSCLNFEECYRGLEIALVTALRDENLGRRVFFMVCVHEWVVKFFSSYFQFVILGFYCRKKKKKNRIVK